MTGDIEDEQESARCDYCGRRFDRPSFARCGDKHPQPTIAQRIAEDVESEIGARRGMNWGNLDDEILNELRDDLAHVIAARLEGRLP